MSDGYSWRVGCELTERLGNVTVRGRRRVWLAERIYGLICALVTALERLAKNDR